MINSHTVLAIVPARGGSKRLPGKNMRELAGKPLIAYSFDEAKKSKYIDRLMLVSDDDEIIEFARKQGIDVPFKEPSELASDNNKDYDFFMYFLEKLKKRENYEPDIIVQLRPTSPLRTVEHIDAAIELLATHPEVDSVRTVAEPEQSPYKMYSVTEDGHLAPLLTIPGEPESFNLPGQKLPKAYKHVGYVDAVWRRTLQEKGKMTGDIILPLVLENALSGINTMSDWERYEMVFAKRKA